MPTWAYFIPNQRTLTCRSINDLVLKQPAYPQIGSVLGNWPFLPPIEQAYLELCCTTGCKAKAPFRNSFTTKVHLLGPRHTRTTGKRAGDNHPFRHRNQCILKIQPPAAFRTVPQPSPFSFPSCSRKGALFAHILTVFARGVTKRVH